MHIISGRGWSFDVLTVYGFSYAGIELLVKIHLDNIVLFKSKETFRNAIKEQPEDSAMVAIIESHIFQKADFSSHVYTICNRKENGKNILYFYDPCEIDVQLKIIQELYEGAILELAFPNKVRQKDGEANCVAFAITDARLLTRTAYIPPRIIKSKFDQVETHLFELDKTFQYDALPIKKTLFNELLDSDSSQDYQHEASGIIPLPEKKSIDMASAFFVLGLLGSLLYEVFSLMNASSMTPRIQP